jgi:F-box-like
MHRVLRIPELLQMVFGVLDLPSNTVNARVCKQWSDIALEMLWRDVDDLYLLLKILAPLAKTVEGNYVSILLYRVA